MGDINMPLNIRIVCRIVLNPAGPSTLETELTEVSPGRHSSVGDTTRVPKDKGRFLQYHLMETLVLQWMARVLVAPNRSESP